MNDPADEEDIVEPPDKEEEDVLKMKGENPLAAEESVEEDDRGSG